MRDTSNHLSLVIRPFAVLHPGSVVCWPLRSNSTSPSPKRVGVGVDVWGPRTLVLPHRARWMDDVMLVI